LDIGHVPLGKTGTSQLQFTCRDGVTFDYSITVMQHNKHFTVGPLTGTMPAHGGTAVTVTFTPTKYSTEHLQLQVLLSEYSAEPMQVLVTGSCKPGLVQQKLLTSAFGGAQPLGGCQLQTSAASEFDKHAWRSTNKQQLASYRARPALNFTFRLLIFGVVMLTCRQCTQMELSTGAGSGSMDLYSKKQESHTACSRQPLSSV
jgi:hypothetical protein